MRKNREKFENCENFGFQTSKILNNYFDSIYLTRIKTVTAMQMKAIEYFILIKLFFLERIEFKPD